MTHLESEIVRLSVARNRLAMDRKQVFDSSGPTYALRAVEAELDRVIHRYVMAERDKKEITPHFVSAAKLMRQYEASRLAGPKMQRCGKFSVNLREFAMYDYIVDFSEVSDARGILEWITHLSDKVWSTKQMLFELSDIIAEAKHIKVYD